MNALQLLSQEQETCCEMSDNLHLVAKISSLQYAATVMCPIATVEYTEGEYTNKMESI